MVGKGGTNFLPLVKGGMNSFHRRHQEAMVISFFYFVSHSSFRDLKFCLYRLHSIGENVILECVQFTLMLRAKVVCQLSKD